MSTPVYFKQWRVGRIQVSATKFVHRGWLPDRHVWHWTVIYDRKHKTSEESTT